MSQRHQTKTPAQFKDWKEERDFRRRLDEEKRNDPHWYSRFSFVLEEFIKLQGIKNPRPEHDRLATHYLKQVNQILKEKNIKWMSSEVEIRPH